jgi:hypothetical protein
MLEASIPGNHWPKDNFLILLLARQRIKQKGVGYKPNSVSRQAGHDHLSWMPVTRHLQRPTRKHWTGSPSLLPYLILLRVGFALPFMSP